MGVSFLRPGDLLVTDGHAEYYVGDGYKCHKIKGGLSIYIT